MLDQVLRYAKDSGIPLDILACHPTHRRSLNFHCVKPLGEITLSLYPQQPFRVPDLVEVQRIFEEGSYTQVICSTEGPMLLAALFLKKAHNVPAHFFVHTDWLAFCRDSLKLSVVQCDRVRRFLRMIYSQFDGIFVLNSEQKLQFSGPQFQLEPARIHQTAHWADAVFRVMPNVSPPANGDPVLIYAGRLSAEKGIFELPEIIRAAQGANPKVRLQVAGTGPDEERLRGVLPHAEFLGWQAPEDLCAAFNRASLLVLPSQFDTFGCVVLEAMASGLPVAAFRCKGPADIIVDGESGFLSNSTTEMATQVSQLVANPRKFSHMREAAVTRSAHYSPQAIMTSLLHNIGVS